MEEFIQLVNSTKKRGRPRKEQPTGAGLIGDTLKKVKKTAQAVARRVGTTIVGKKLAEKAERYADAVLFLSKLPLSPAVKEALRKHGDEPILKMVAYRKPVQKVLNGLMNAVSLGSFNKKFGRLPYDDLFHLALWVTTASGTYAIEKEEVIKITPNPKSAEQGEFNDISPVPSGLTMNKLMVGAEKKLGDKFTRYDASSNNCQDFIIALLEGSNAGSAADRAFIKQDTDSLFKDDSFLRRVARKLTNVGASVSTAITGVDDTPIASTNTTSQFEIPTPADTSVSDGAAGGVGKRKRAVAGDEGERGRRLRAVRDLVMRAYPLDGSAPATDALEILNRYAPGETIPTLMRRLPFDAVVEILISLLPGGYTDPYASPIPTQEGYDRPPPFPPSPPSDAEGAGRNRKIPKKAVKGQRTIPEITAAQEAEAVRLADQLRNPSVMSRVHDLLARQARGELDFNFRPIYPPTPPTEPVTPEGSQGAGMVKRGRGRPRKMKGGALITLAQRGAIDDLLNQHYTLFLRSRYNPDKFEKVKKEIFDEVIPEMPSLGVIDKKLVERLMNRYEARR
jgi:hypothetical protein